MLCPPWPLGGTVFPMVFGGKASKKMRQLPMCCVPTRGWRVYAEGSISWSRRAQHADGCEKRVGGTDKPGLIEKHVSQQVCRPMTCLWLTA